MLRKISFLLFSLSLLTVPLMRVSAQNEGQTYVLVHGAFQDAAGWESVKTALEAAGHTVLTVQLPARNDDNTPRPEATLAAYTEAVLEVVNAQAAPVVLVGHSFGGIVISAVAEAAPDKIDTLVYLAAYLPQNGDNLVTLAGNDHYSALGQEGNFILAEDFTYASVNQDVFASAFCPDCDETQAAAVAESQRDEPLAPLNEPVTLTEENFGTVYKVYILTAEDIVVSPQLQAYMLSNTPVDEVYAVNAGHAPYITAADKLAEILGGLSAAE